MKKFHACLQFTDYSNFYLFFQSFPLFESEEIPSFGFCLDYSIGSGISVEIQHVYIHSFRRNVSAKNKSYHNSFPPLINRHFHIIIIFKLHVFDQHFRLYAPLLQTLPKHVSSQQLICYFIDEKTKT